MQLNKTTKQIKCDVAGCSNIAEYSMALKKSFLSSGAMFFCKECLNNMYSSIGKVVVPASVKNVYKKNDNTNKTITPKKNKISGDKNAKQ